MVVSVTASFSLVFPVLPEALNSLLMLMGWGLADLLTNGRYS
jgi:hypothetical protein